MERRGLSAPGQKASESLEALKESEQRLRRLVDVMPGLVSYVDRHRRYVFVNRVYESWFGKTRGEVIGKTTDDVLGPGVMPHAGPYIERALRGEEVRFEIEGLYPGGPRWVDGSYVPDLDETGAVVGFFVFVIDITKRKLAEEAERESKARHREALKALQIADRRKDEFLATMSHELRNPLAAIRNAVELLKVSASKDPDARWVSDMVQRQLQHMSRLLEDLLDVSRVAHDKLILRRERVELSDVVSTALETCRPRLDAAGHRVSVKVPSPVFLMADAVRLAQVFSNLLSNAIKYTAPGGHIDLVGERRGDELVISVRDDGIGIPAELLPHVFDKFSQGAQAFEQAEGGLGLGLSLVKALVELHGGRVEARSAGAGSGSEFVITLPALPDGAAAPSQSRAVRRGGAAVKRRVLIADDMNDITDSLAIIMRLVGLEVETAYDGQQALERAEEFRPHVVILDIAMPNLDGYEACRLIRQRPWGPSVTLIALTGWGGQGTRQRTEEAGFNHHLVKPVEPGALLELLASLDRPELSTAPK